MSLSPSQFRPGRFLMLAFLAILLQRDIGDLATQTRPPGSVLAGQILVAGICAVYGWFWVRVAGSDGWLRSSLALATLTLLVATFTVLDPNGSYPFYYPFYYCAIVAGAAYGWRVSLAAVAGVVALATFLVAMLHGRGVVEADLVIVMSILGLGSIAVRRHVSNFVQLQAARDEIRRLAVAEERLRLARDLHDQLGQSLSTVVLQSELVALELTDANPEATRARVQTVVNTARGSLEAMRAVVAGYRQPALEEEFDEARSLMEASGIRCTVERNFDRLSPDTSAALAWVVREATTNILRHSSARQADVVVGRENGLARLRVTDNGRGSLSPGYGNGLAGVDERAAALGGRMHVQTGPGKGFTLTVEIPEPP